jgi:hypothetical protein
VWRRRSGSFSVDGALLVSFFSDYTKSLKAFEVEELFDLGFYRPLGFLFVKLVYRTSITPNQITILSALAGLLAGVFLGIGSASALVVAGLLLVVYDVLDCADGQLARINKNGTRMGRILDGAADYLVSIAAYLGIGIGFASESSSPVVNWVLTIAAGVSNAVQSGLLDFYRNRFLDYQLHRVSVLDDDLEEFRREYQQVRQQGNRLGDRIILWLYLQYSSIQRLAVSRAQERARPKKVLGEEYVRENRILMRLWTFLGPTTQVTLLIGACLFNCIGLYLWVIVLGGNVLSLVLKYFQNRADSRLGLSGS